MNLRVLCRSLPLAVLALCLSWVAAWAQATSALNCSGTAGSAAATVTLSPMPTLYVAIYNVSATAKLWINPVGGTAAANTAGSLPLESEGNNVTLPPLALFSILASAGGTPYTCFYR